jgi:predicted ribosome quality control (RQC) complex YloA/Tae2 family protein
MSRLIPAAERVQRARDLIQKARDLPIPVENGKNNFSYIAQVKALLQDARDLVKYITKTPSATPEIKEQVAQIYLEADRADREILH